MKFALASHVLPPSWSGQAVTLYRLLKGVDSREYCLISQQEPSDLSEIAVGNGHLNARRYTLKAPARRASGRGLIDVPMRIGSMARQISHIIRQEQCQAAIACTGDFYDLPATFLASRFARVPFYAYVFDYYSQQWTEPKARRLAERLEPTLMKRAAGVIVPNEFMRDELQRRYGIEPTVIRNSCELSLYGATNRTNSYRAETSKDVKIVYTGAISAAQLDALRNLIKAIALLGHDKARLHIYTAQQKSMVREAADNNRVVFHNHVPMERIPDIQQQADILFLPLSFNSPYPEVIKTSAPGKIGDYLASGGPILVHAPADSFLSWYFREHGCGLVVDENDPAKLADAVERLLGDCDLQLRLRTRAWECARLEFSNEEAQARFARLLKIQETVGTRFGDEDRVC